MSIILINTSYQHFSTDMKNQQARTYTINVSNSEYLNHNTREDDTCYQRIDSSKFKSVQNHINKKKPNYSSGACNDINSMSSADEWVDLEEEELESENDNQNSSRSVSTSKKSGINPNQLGRPQNFIR